MNNAKIFQWTTLVLVVLNIGLVFFMTMSRPHQNGHHGPDRNKHLIAEKLGFDQTQMEQYEVLINQHRTSISETDREISQAKQALYALLDNEDQESKDSLMNVIAAQQHAIEEVHFNHFVDIKRLCRDEQLPAYHELTKELGRMFAPEMPQRPRKH
jgi:periplasmic protein CpxP/Spy